MTDRQRFDLQAAELGLDVSELTARLIWYYWANVPSAYQGLVVFFDERGMILEVQYFRDGGCYLLCRR